MAAFFGIACMISVILFVASMVLLPFAGVLRWETSSIKTCIKYSLLGSIASFVFLTISNM